MAYQYNPNLHVKIWLSEDPNTFLNLENQIRLIEMREKNPKDTIHLVYDSSLLTQHAAQAFHVFCKENRVIPIDAHTIKEQLKTAYEYKLYQFYKEEIHHLKTGGNLAVASDILRWLSPIFKLGTYTDFDFPIDTSNLPSPMLIDAPLLLNIGSLKMSKKEFILANNDFVALIDEQAALKKIERVQSGILAKLEFYDTDFLERTEQELINDGFIHRQLLKFFRNRSESIYIARSKEIIMPTPLNSSLRVREHINEVMNDPNKFLDFNRITPNETYQAIIQRLRKELQTQLNLGKFLFFNKEYFLIKNMLEQNDETFLAYLMRKEHDLYLKSIVVCTSGPIEISNALFNGYVVDADQFIKEVQPLSFNHYGLKKAFRSKNSIPLHENVLGMLKFLGVRDGELNDSSWLDSGKKLQSLRTIDLAEHQKKLALSLPFSLSVIKKEIETFIQKNSSSHFNLFFKAANQAKAETHALILSCFDQEKNEFDINLFKEILFSLNQNKKEMHAKKIINDLNALCHEAVLFSLAKDKKLKVIAPACRLGLLDPTKSCSKHSKAL